MANKNEDVIEIDLLKLGRALWKRAWVIMLVVLLCGSLAFTGTMFLITPLYESSVLMYVNSNTVSVGSISISDLNAAKSLIDTYTVILNTRATLNDVIEEAELTCTYDELVESISAEAVNGTEVFRITVTDPDSVRATLIANTIARVLPDKIASIVEGSSARIVDMAVVPARPSSPSYTKNTAIGVLLGLLLSCGIIVVRELMDDKVYDSDYLIQSYDLPILAVVPDLLATSGGGYKYGYYQNPSADKEQ